MRPRPRRRDRVRCATRACAARVCSRITPSGNIHPAIPRPRSAQPAMKSDSAPTPAPQTPKPADAVRAPRTRHTPYPVGQPPHGEQHRQVHELRHRENARDAAAVQAELARAAQRDEELSHRRPRERQEGADREHQPDDVRRRSGRGSRRGACRADVLSVSREAPAQDGSDRKGHEHGRGCREERDGPGPAHRKQSDPSETSEDTEHAGELEDVEANRGGRAVIVPEDGRESADHAEGVAQPGQDPAEHEHREMAQPSRATGCPRAGSPATRSASSRDAGRPGLRSAHRRSFARRRTTRRARRAASRRAPGFGRSPAAAVRTPRCRTCCRTRARTGPASCPGCGWSRAVAPETPRACRTAPAAGIEGSQWSTRTSGPATTDRTAACPRSAGV